MIQNEFYVRLISGIFMAGGMIFIIFSPFYIMILFLVLICFIATFEFKSALQNQSILLNSFLLWSHNILILGIYFFLNRYIAFAVLLSVAIVQICLWFILCKTKKHPVSIQYLIFHLFWIITPCLSIMEIWSMQHGIKLVLFLILIIATHDIFAYFGGRQFGKHPLAPKLSPKKTWEGFLCGFIGSILSGIGFNYWVPIFPKFEILPPIFILSILGPIGDLVESKFKRFCNIKDSSHFIPGHGGVLDRIDAYLIASSTFFIYLYFVFPEWVFKSSNFWNF